MASLPPIFSFTPSRTRVYARTTKGTTTSGSKEEKGLWDFILGALTKEEQFYETDPLFKKAEDKTTAGGGNGRGTTRSVGRKNSVSIPQKKKKKNGVFGGLFAKK